MTQHSFHVIERIKHLLHLRHLSGVWGTRQAGYSLALIMEEGRQPDKLDGGFSELEELEVFLVVNFLLWVEWEIVLSLEV